MCCTAWVCGGCASRVGNLVVLWATEEECPAADNNENGNNPASSSVPQRRPKLRWVMGPYWPVNIFITFPLIFGVSGWTFYRAIWLGTTDLGMTQRVTIIIMWSILTALMIVSLAMISCRDPGVLYRHLQPPNEDWRWNDQAMTYRPSSARFDRECQVVIEGFDHT